MHTSVSDVQWRSLLIDDMQLARVDHSLKVAAVRKMYPSSSVDEGNSHITQFFKVSSY